MTSKLLKLTLAIAIFSFTACSTIHESHLQLAETAKQLKEYQVAIQHYQDHLNKRLKVEKRPEWENPYIYLLDIGDMHLAMDNVNLALTSYLEAKEKNVRQELIADRIRLVANYYRKKGENDLAIELLEKYNDLDPELNNLILDQIAKDIIKNAN